MANPFARWFRRRPDDGPAPHAGAERPDVPPTSQELQAIRVEDYVGTDEAANERLVRESFVDKARQYLGRLPMAREVVALYFCMLDPTTPLWVKGVVSGALAYFILPLDAIPDILPVFGLSDDVTILTAAITAVAAYVTAEHYQKADTFLAVEPIAPAPDAGRGQEDSRNAANL